MEGPRRAVDREEELRLIQEFLAGDEGAFETLVKAHQKNVYSLALRMTRNPSSAQDLSQEVFVQFYLHAREFRGEASLKTWLYRTTMNACLNYLKTSGRYKGMDHEWSMADPTPGPLDNLEEEERQRSVEEAIHFLPPQQKAALILRVQEGLPYEEVAKSLGCSVSAAKAHYHFAVQNIKKRVGY